MILAMRTLSVVGCREREAVLQTTVEEQRGTPRTCVSNDRLAAATADDGATRGTPLLKVAMTDTLAPRLFFWDLLAESEI
jgi:hypothetical protein